MRKVINKKEKWYNKKLPPEYSLSIVLIMFIITLFMPLKTIECSKDQNICTIYSRNVIFRKPKLVNQFNISDIKYYDIKSRHIRYQGEVYSLNIHLYSGETIYLDNKVRSYERAEEIYKNIINSENYVLNGNYWKTLKNNY